MLDDKTLFKEREVKSVSLTIKLTPSQKDWICKAAAWKGLNVSRFMLYLVGLEYERLGNTSNPVKTADAVKSSQSSMTDNVMPHNPPAYFGFDFDEGELKSHTHSKEKLISDFFDEG